jgi:hypothetical protein
MYDESNGDKCCITAGFWVLSPWRHLRHPHSQCFCSTSVVIDSHCLRDKDRKRETDYQYLTPVTFDISPPSLRHPLLSLQRAKAVFSYYFFSTYIFIGLETELEISTALSVFEMTRTFTTATRQSLISTYITTP